MAKSPSILSRLGKGVMAVVLASSMSIVGTSVAFADDDADDTTVASYWSNPTSAAEIGSNLLKTYGVRAGSAGGDFLGITNTNFDWTSGTASSTVQYDAYTSADFTSVTVAGLAIWATSVNENANPYYANMWYNAVNGLVGTDGAATQATTWMNNSNSWGDSGGNASTFADSGEATISGLEYEPEIIFGANKTTNWANFSVEETNIYQWVTGEENTEGYTPDAYVNNDATNVWTQIYTMGQLATTADELTADSDLYTRYDDSDATESAVNYEKAIKGQLLYLASLIDSGELESKTVAYLYAIDADGTGYFFVPEAEGLTEGVTTVYSDDNSATNNDDNYAANNSTINMGYMATLPFVTTTFDSGTELEGGIVMAVENLYKENPVCTVDASSASDVMADVDVIIYNSTTYTSDMSGTSNGRNSSGVTNDYNGDALSADEVATWAAQYGFSGSTIAGDDYGTSTKQGYGTAAATEDGMAPLLYCQRNYTCDKNTRAAWAFSMVYPEAYEGNNDATYGYWVDAVYHVNTDSVASVVQYMTNQSSEVTYTSDTCDFVEAAALAGYEWWVTTGQYDSEWSDYAYYNGSSRASYFSDTSSDEEVDTIGIFAPSSLWAAEVDATFITEVAGDNLYETAYLEAVAAFNSADTVILATGTNYADALAASALAGAIEAPIVLTNGSQSTLNAYAAQAIDELGATSVIIVGGTSAVSADIADAIEADGLSVERIYGANRYATAEEIYYYGNDLDVWGDQIIVASGTGYADALSVSSLAYAQAYPILLANGSQSLTDASKAILRVNKGGVIVVGGTSAVSDSVVDTYGATRLAGGNRYATSVAIAEYAVENGYLSWDGVAITTGTNYPDALAAAALQGDKGSVLLLVSDKTYETVFASIDADSVTNATIIGGTSAVSQTIRDAFAALFA